RLVMDTYSVQFLAWARSELERAKGFEPSTPTLARSCSTTELHPHPCPPRRGRCRRADVCQKVRRNATGLMTFLFDGNTISARPCFRFAKTCQRVRLASP